MDIIKELHEHLKAEIEDMKKYTALSEAAEWPQDAQILRDIAREEHCHARHLYRLLERHGALTDDEKMIPARHNQER